MSNSISSLAPTVLKFGGTSVRDAEAMRRVVAIVERERGARPVVVTSACAGVTDMLLDCARCCGAADRDQAHAIVAELRRRHTGIIHELSPAGSSRQSELMQLLDEIEQLVDGVLLLRELTDRTIDAFASYGERLSSLLLTEAFSAAGWRAALADSRRCIITDDCFINARPLMDEIDLRAPSEILPMLESHEVVIAQGFIGSTRDGVTTTIGRGGSDHTGALLGAALGARDIQIWTDVSGILTADPRIVPAARAVPEVTFSEARELAWFGAKVIHPDTILPAVRREIPVVIRNSLRPDDAGTRILPDGSVVAPGIHSITMKRGMLLLALSPRKPFDPEHSIEEVLGLFANHGVPIQCAVTAESRATVIVAADDFHDILMADLERTCCVETTEGMALLCMTGAALRTESGILSDPLEAVGHLPLAFVAAGSSDHTVLLALPEAEAREAVAAIHRRLFEQAHAPLAGS